jgi:hypothetical protein
MENKNIDMKQVEKAIDLLLKEGKALATCPNCGVFLSLEERDNLKCSSGCKKSFKFEDVLYYPGAEKDGN